MKRLLLPLLLGLSLFAGAQGWREFGAKAFSEDDSLVVWDATVKKLKRTKPGWFEKRYTYAELAAMTKANAERFYWTKEKGTEGFWEYKPGDDTTVSNMATAIRPVAGGCFHRIIPDDIVRATWWRPANDTVTDMTAIYQAFLDWGIKKKYPDFYLPPGYIARLYGTLYINKPDAQVFNLYSPAHRIKNGDSPLNSFTFYKSNDGDIIRLNLDANGFPADTSYRYSRNIYIRGIHFLADVHNNVVGMKIYRMRGIITGCLFNRNDIGLYQINSDPPGYTGDFNNYSDQNTITDIDIYYPKRYGLYLVNGDANNLSGIYLNYPYKTGNMIAGIYARGCNNMVINGFLHADDSRKNGALGRALVPGSAVIKLVRSQGVVLNGLTVENSHCENIIDIENSKGVTITGVRPKLFQRGGVKTKQCNAIHVQGWSTEANIDTLPNGKPAFVDFWDDPASPSYDVTFSKLFLNSYPSEFLREPTSNREWDGEWGTYKNYEQTVLDNKDKYVIAAPLDSVAEGTPHYQFPLNTNVFIDTLKANKLFQLPGTASSLGDEITVFNRNRNNNRAANVNGIQLPNGQSFAFWPNESVTTVKSGAGVLVTQAGTITTTFGSKKIIGLGTTFNSVIKRGIDLYDSTGKIKLGSCYNIPSQDTLLLLANCAFNYTGKFKSARVAWYVKSQTFTKAENIVHVYSNKAVVAGDYIPYNHTAFYLHTDSADISLTLPTPANAEGRDLEVFNMGTHKANVKASGDALINGVLSYTLKRKFSSVVLRSDSAQFIAVQNLDLIRTNYALGADSGSYTLHADSNLIIPVLRANTMFTIPSATASDGMELNVICLNNNDKIPSSFRTFLWMDGTGLTKFPNNSSMTLRADKGVWRITSLTNLYEWNVLFKNSTTSNVMTSGDIVPYKGLNLFQDGTAAGYNYTLTTAANLYGRSLMMTRRDTFSTHKVYAQGNSGELINNANLFEIPAAASLTKPTIVIFNSDGTKVWAGILGGGSGNVSITSANGFAGTVNSSTGAVTLTTTITGLLKGNGTAISAAVSGTDIKTVNGVSLLGSGDVSTATALASGSVAFGNGTGITEDNTNFHYSTANKRLGLLTNTATHTFTMGSTSTGIAAYNTVDQTTNYERFASRWSSNVYRMETQVLGSGTARNILIGANSRTLTIGNSAITGGVAVDVSSGSTSASVFGVGGTFTNSTGTPNASVIYPTINQTGGGYRALWISPYEQAVGAGNKLLLDVGKNSAAALAGTHTSYFVVDNTGVVKISQLANAGVLKADATGNLVPAVAGTDYMTPGGLAGYVPLTGTSSITGNLMGANGFTVGSGNSFNSFNTGSTNENNSYAISPDFTRFSRAYGVANNLNARYVVSAQGAGAVRVFRTVADSAFQLHGDALKYSADYSAEINAIGGLAVPHRAYNDARYQTALNLTTTGTGEASLIGNTLNIPSQKAYNVYGAPGSTIEDDEYTVVLGFVGTVNLPTAAGRTGKIFVLKSGTNGSITIDPAGTENIDEAATYELTVKHTGIVIQSTGSGWLIIGKF